MAGGPSDHRGGEDQERYRAREAVQVGVCPTVTCVPIAVERKPAVIWTYSLNVTVSYRRFARSLYPITSGMMVHRPWATGLRAYVSRMVGRWDCGWVWIYRPLIAGDEPAADDYGAEFDYSHGSSSSEDGDS